MSRWHVILRGSGGPGGANSFYWLCFLLHYGAHSSQLREAVAGLAMHLANGIDDWTDIWALRANRLIALDKYPGVHPIGIMSVFVMFLAVCSIGDWLGDSVCLWCGSACL